MHLKAAVPSRTDIKSHVLLSHRVDEYLRPTVSVCTEQNRTGPVKHMVFVQVLN